MVPFCSRIITYQQGIPAKLQREEKEKRKHAQRGIINNCIPPADPANVHIPKLSYDVYISFVRIPSIQKRSRNNKPSSHGGREASLPGVVFSVWFCSPFVSGVLFPLVVAEVEKDEKGSG